MTKRANDKVTDRVTDLEVETGKSTVILDNITKTLTRLEGKLVDIDHVIRGNGVPGIKEEMVRSNERIAGIEELIVMKREDHRNILNAVYATCGSVVVGIIILLLTHFVR